MYAAGTLAFAFAAGRIYDGIAVYGYIACQSIDSHRVGKTALTFVFGRKLCRAAIGSYSGFFAGYSYPTGLGGHTRRANAGRYATGCIYCTFADGYGADRKNTVTGACIAAFCCNRCAAYIYCSAEGAYSVAVLVCIASRGRKCAAAFNIDIPFGKNSVAGVF